MDVSEWIDLHVHIGPEILPRRFNVQQIVRQEKGKIGGMALKNHCYPTMPLIKSAEVPDDLLLIGSVALNNYNGGLNADAIYASAEISKYPLIVWFPTISARNFLESSKYEIPPEWVGENFVSRASKDVPSISVLDTQENLSAETRRALEMIKEKGCILATGHISWKESKKLVEEAVKMGIEKIIITHPIYQRINMPLEVQQELAKNNGVYIEQCYSMYSIDKISAEKIAEQVKAIGPEKCIISSDVGQISSPSPSEALGIFTKLLIDRGLSEKDTEIMGRDNPRKLIGFQKK